MTEFNSPLTMAQHLVTYLSRDEDVRLHVQRYFGRPFDIKRIARLRKEMPTGRRKTDYKPSQPISLAPAEISCAKNGSDLLLKALARYHFQRASDSAQRQHWAGLM